MYNAGALVFKLITLGAQAFKADQADAKQAIENTGKAAQTSKSQVDGLGTATDETSKKSKDSKKPLDEQGKATEEVGKKSKKSSEEQKKQAQATQEQIHAAKELSTALNVAGLAVGALVTLSIAKSSEFDQAMSNVRAATMSTAAEQRALGEAALEAGADTAYSASEAAAAEEELAKAGQSVSQIIGGSLNGALALAAAGQLQVARSAEIMATTLTQFRLPAEQAAHVSDVLAAGAGKAQGSVDDLSLALSYVGPLAGSVGFSLDQTAGTLAYFATQGIIGEKAGTSLRGVLASLQAPSAAAANEMQKYGINMFDANGKMLSLSGIAEQLKTRLGGLTQQERLAALGRIFGNESLNAATLLYEGGATAVEDWTNQVNDAGYAAEQAALRQDNLAGDIEKLGGAFDTALIRTGSGANDVLRTMVQAVTEMVDVYGEAPAPIQVTALVIGSLVTAGLLFAGTAVGMRVKLIELKTALDQTNTSFRTTAIAGGLAGIALTGVLTVVGLIMSAQAEAKQRAESYADALRQTGSAADEATRDLVAANLSAKESFLWMESDSAYDAAKKLGLGIDLVTDAAEGNADAQAKLREQLEFGGYGSEEFKSKLDDLGLSLTDYQRLSATVTQAVERENTARDEGRKLVDQQTEATDESAESSKTAAEAYLEQADSVEDLNAKLTELIDRINEINGTNQDAISANADWQQSLAGIAEQAVSVGTSLNEATVAGSANAAALSDVAQSAQEAAEKQLAVDQQTMSGKDAADKYYATLVAQRQAFIDSATAAGYNADEVKALADRVFQLPSEKEMEIIADTAQAQIEIDSYISKNTGREIIVKIGTSRVAQGPGGSGGITQADGGIVTFADGGLRPALSFHAAGSVSENHVAQIARAGEWRIWAEDETGGEGYVPLAPSKRARSEMIMSEIADRFGGLYIPGSARRYAEGAGPAPSSGRGGDTFIERVDVRLPAADPEIAAVLFGDKLRNSFASTPGR
ncbi:phage tail tape measure protein [Microbacterium sp. LWO14-1.2]|uniref:phage tail tape measure protein n=1 Tax=Microbacterium sp. LWO14-1.2 TaxID=3135263 RepID=UPI0031387ABB